MTQPLGEIIAAFPDLADRLLAEHHDDGTGHCRACPVGAQGGHHTWPCSLHDIALQARHRRDNGT